jgi:hypothetical protein
MKKTILTIAIAAGTLFAANAQQMMSKKGTPILPAAGSWGLSIAATPFMNYAGNLLNGNAFNAAPTFGSAIDPVTVRGRYFMADDAAIRVDFTLGITSTTTESANAVDPTKTDETKMSATAFGIGAGYEMKRGKGRLIASYGPQVFIKMTPFTGVDPTFGPVTGKIEFTDANDAAGNYTAEGGNTFAFGLGGFMGVEYFFAPQMSIGGQFDLNLQISSTSERTNKVGDAPEGTLSGKTSSFGFGNIAGATSLNLNLYF